MPKIDFDSQYSNKGDSLFISLKNKNDKIHFRIIGDMFFDGKHFIKQPNGDWLVVPCTRINNNVKCEYCEEYFKIMSKIKKDTPKDERKKIKDEAKKFKPTLNFYIPIIDRSDGKFKIFKTTLSIRRKIENEVQLGTPVLKRDFIVLRTEQPGADYYSFTRVDSSDTKPLTEQEKNEIKKYEQTNILSLINPESKEFNEF